MKRGFQGSVLSLVFPEAQTPTSTLVVKVGVEMCLERAWQPQSLNPTLYVEFLARKAENNSTWHSGPLFQQYGFN